MKASRRVFAAPLLGSLLAVASVVAAHAASPGNESAEQNVRESQQYEQLLCSNPSFRARRVAQECGPITDPQLHQSCEASFACGDGANRKAPNFRKAPPSTTIR